MAVGSFMPFHYSPFVGFCPARNSGILNQDFTTSEKKALDGIERMIRIYLTAHTAMSRALFCSVIASVPGWIVLDCKISNRCATSGGEESKRTRKILFNKYNGLHAREAKAEGEGGIGVTVCDRICLLALPLFDGGRKQLEEVRR